MRSTDNVAALGFTVKSGWACAVVLTGSAASPRAVASHRIDLSDPAIPAARQPYHAGFGTARSSGRELSGLIASVKRFGGKTVTELIRHYEAAGYQLRGAGIVVGSVIDPKRIANEHIRIHALEGQLFRRVVQEAAAKRRLAPAIWRERDLYLLATGALERPEQALRGTVTAFGRALSGSWRAEHKAAALAAWLVLAGSTQAKRSMRRK